MSTFISQFASKLICQHCGKTHGTQQWPLYGDRVGFCYRKELEPYDQYVLKVHCPHCNQDWYVAWDEDPGSFGRSIGSSGIFSV